MRARAWLVAAASVVLVLALLSVSAAAPPAGQTAAGAPARSGNSELDRILRGYKIAPVKLITKGRDKDLLGLGSYIVNAQGGCNDCHTNPPYAPGGDPYQGQPKRINTEGYLAGGTSFGPFISANITPDENGLPAGLTFEEYKQLIRTGHDPDDPDELLQVMPWPVFQDMTDRDIRAVYEYLRSIPSIDTGGDD